jgi:hypothetical protein
MADSDVSKRQKRSRSTRTTASENHMRGVVIPVYASPDGTGNGLSQTSFWNGGNRWMREAAREMRDGG